jgi:hypothetical protein
MSPMIRSIAAALVVVPTLALGQNIPPGYQAPTGHRQPNASDVPANDSIDARSGAAAGTGAPVYITPQERRDNAIDRSLCATPTC